MLGKIFKQIFSASSEQKYWKMFGTKVFETKFGKKVWNKDILTNH